MASKTIWHVGGWNRNYGDFSIQAGLQRMLRRVASEPLDFVPVDCQKTWFHPALIDCLNAEADLLLVGGGGMVFNRPEDDSRSGWQFNIGIDDLARIETPLVVHGIGFNQFAYDRSGFRPQMNDHLRRTQETAALFSTRNEGTRAELGRRGLDVDTIAVIPDSGMFVAPGPIALPRPDTGLTIGVNWAGDPVEQRWPGDPDETAARVARSLAEALRDVLAARGGGRVLWVPHLLDIDGHTRPIFEEALGASLIDLEREMLHIYPPSLYQVPFLADVYRQCDLVIGMRGHANIIPFGVGTRVIGIGSHNKNRYFLEEIGEPQALIDVRRYPEGCGADDMRALIERVLDDEALPQRLSDRRAAFVDAADAFNRKVLALIDG